MFSPLVRQISWRKWQPTPVLLPGESHGQRSLMGYTVYRVTQSQTRLKWLNTYTRCPYSAVAVWFRFHRTKMLDCQGKKKSLKGNRFVVAKGEGEWGTDGLGISRCKLLYIDWINSKVLLYSTGTYIKYPVMNHMEKNMKKNVDVCITESLFCTSEMNTTL